MLNISQLTFTIDSLYKKHNDKINNEFKDFKNLKLYEVRNPHIEDPKPVEQAAVTAVNSKKVLKFDTKVLFDSLSIADKSVVLTKAVESLKDGTGIIFEKNESSKYEVRNIRRFEVEWNKKLTLSFACIVFFLIGAPLGAIIRKGGLGTPAVISIFFFVIYYVISITGQKLVEDNVVGTFAGMWAASYILLPIGIFLTYKATTDSVILNIETYLLFFKKIGDRIYRIFINGSGKNNSTD